jgi:hypothetical protein
VKTTHLAALSILAALAFCLGFALPLRATASAPPAAASTAAPSGAAGATPAAATSPLPPPLEQVPDPIEHPGDAADDLKSMYDHGGKVMLLLAVIGVLLRALESRWAWLRVGWRKAATAISLVGITTLVDTWLSTGARGSIYMWLFGGVAAVVVYVLRAEPAKAPPAPAAS